MISRNDLLEYAGPDRRILRVLWIDPAQTVAYLFDVQAKVADAELVRLPALAADIEAGRARVLDDDPYLVLVPQELLPDKHLQLRARAWDIIRDLTAMEPAIYEPRRRGQLVSATTQRHGVSHPTIYRYLRRYWQRGQTPNALLPDYSNSGGRGKTRAASEGVKRGRPRKDAAQPGVNADEAMRKVFRVAVARHAATHAKFSRRAAYGQMIRDFFCERRIDAGTGRVQRLQLAAALPTFGQFNYWLEQDGSLAAPGRPAPLAAEAGPQRPGRPGAAFHIEAMQADLHLVSRADRSQVAGKPMLYVVTDAFSGMVAGLYVSLDQAAWPQALMALANGAADKQRYCLRYGRDIAAQDWPSRHLPEILFAPAALAAGWNGDALLNNFNVRCMVSEAAPGAWRAELEKRFTLLAPGQGGALAITERAEGGNAGRLDAVLDVDQFTRIVIDCLLHYNQHHHGDGGTPLQLWDWGVAQRGAGLKQYPEDLVRCCLLPVSDALVTADGICLNGTYYNCARAIDERWFERARQRGQWRVKVASDAANLDTVYLLDQHAPMQFHACHMAERSGAHRQLSSVEISRLRASDFLARQHTPPPGQHASFDRIVAALAN